MQNDFYDLIAQVNQEMNKVPLAKKFFDKFANWYLDFAEGKSTFTTGLPKAVEHLLTSFHILENTLNTKIEEATTESFRYKLRPDLVKLRRNSINEFNHVEELKIHMLGCKDSLKASLAEAIKLEKIKTFNPYHIALLDEAAKTLDYKCLDIRYKNL